MEDKEILIELEDAFDMPIAYHRVFAIWVGVTGAIFLSQALYWSKRTKDEDGWFYKTREDWELETGLTRYEQETARKRCIKAGFLEERLAGNPARMFYRVSLKPLIEQIIFSWGESHQLDGGNPTNKVDGNQPTIQYTENTTENKNKEIFLETGNSNTDGKLKELQDSFLRRKERKAKKQPFGSSRPSYTPPQKFDKPEKKGSHAEHIR